MSVTPDLGVATRFLNAHPPEGRVLMCAITGSHQYGFPSVDSDLDIKGIHLAPTAAVVGLGGVRDAHDRLEDFEGTECDLTTHELGCALQLLLKGNGNMLERLTSPLQLIESDAQQALVDLIPAALSRRVYHHYSGYFRGMQREHGKRGRAKSMLYAYRVALTGIHLLESAEVEAHLPTLADRYGYPELHDLIAQKQGSEKGSLDPEASSAYEARWPELEAHLIRARDTSPLPEAPPDRDRVNALLVDLRLG